MVTNADINWWLSQNPGASDGVMRSTMDKYGVGTKQVADATGVNFGQVQGRYNAAQPGSQQQMGPFAPGYSSNVGTSGQPALGVSYGSRPRYGAADINGWLASNPGASDVQMRQAMDQFGVSPYDVSSATGTGLGDVLARYRAAGPTQGVGQMAPGGGSQATANPMWQPGSPYPQGNSSSYNTQAYPGASMGSMGGANGTAMGSAYPNAMMRSMYGGAGAGTGTGSAYGQNAMTNAMYGGGGRKPYTDVQGY